MIVAGCLPQRYKHELPKLLPGVDAFIGTPGKFRERKREKNEVVKATPPWFAYVKIADGCDNRCAYCAIPLIRGKLRIRKAEAILKEVELLAKNGVKEIIYVAQDTTVYPDLPSLLKRTARIKGVRWIRIMYAHPAHVTDELIETMAAERKIVKYLDLPIQHACDKILQQMRRNYFRPQLENLILKIRRRIPDIALRTSVLVGFPGENEARFEELLEFVKWARFDKLGAFAYSREKGTPASRMRGQVSEETKKRRLNKLMRVQARISKERNLKMIGKTLEAMVEGKGAGRAYFDAPGIDGRVFIKSNQPLKPGEIASVRITGAKTYDLFGCLT